MTISLNTQSRNILRVLIIFGAKKLKFVLTKLTKAFLMS